MIKNSYFKKETRRKYSLKKRCLIVILITLISSKVRGLLKKSFKNMGLIMLTLIALNSLWITSCEEHQDYPDTSIKVGDVLCTDGSIESLSKVKDLSLTPIGVVFYVNQSGIALGSGYAVSLEDLPSKYSLADTLGVAQGTSANVDSYDGNSNTYALYSSSKAPSRAAIALFDYWQYGQSAFIPSVAELRLLYASLDIINPVIIELGGAPLLSEAEETWYWSSTEVSTQEDNKAWLFSFSSGAIHETPKNEAHKIRPIITLWYE